MIESASALILALLALMLPGIALSRRPLGHFAVYGGCCLCCAGLAAIGLASIAAPASDLRLPIGVAGGVTRLRLDALSGFFLALIGLGGAGASLFALGYARHEAEPQRTLPFYPAFLAAMALVAVAADAYAFLFGWEAMSLASWALVTAHHKQEGNAQAGSVYLVMAAFSFMVLLGAFVALGAGGGSGGFEAIRTARPARLAAAAGIAALVGAGSKAGLVPMHVWLPLAHPAAPSHVSALMSGVMTKVAVYGFVRIAFDLAGPMPWWVAAAVLMAGGATAVLGVLYALIEGDLKRLLAYSTVENIGIVFIGLGLALAFQGNGLGAGAALAMTAALLHALNHTVFKTLLFMGAGAVGRAASSFDLDRLGGLVRAMPVTAAAALVGCLAIAGLPPLNGFVSEWLTFQAVLLRPELAQWGLKLLIPLDGALLALTAALASACFVRAFGIGFLGRPRSAAAAAATETDRWSLAAMAGFAALCLIGGIAPGAIIDTIGPVTRMLLGQDMPLQSVNTWSTIIPVTAGRSSYNGLLAFSFIATSAALAALAARWLSARTRRAPTWDCGFPDLPPNSQYTAGSFAQPLRRVFATRVFGAHDSVDMPDPGDLRPANLVQSIRDPVWDFAYRPLGLGVNWLATQANAMQYLTIRRLLGLVFATLVALLLALTLWQ